MNPNFIEDRSGKCSKVVVFNPKLAYSEGNKTVCRRCIERVVNPFRRTCGRMPIFVSPKAYREKE